MCTRLAMLGLLGVAIGFSGVSGCRSVPDAARDQALAPAPLASVEAETLKHFTRARELLDAQEIAPDGVMRAGDQVLLGLLVRARGEVRVRYIRLTVMQETPSLAFHSFKTKVLGKPETLTYASMVVVARTELFDQDAKVLADSSSNAPSSLMGLLHNAMEVLWKYQPVPPASGSPAVAGTAGAPDATAAKAVPQAPAEPPQMDRAETEAFVYGLGSLFVFSGYLGDRMASPMTDLLWEVVDRPSLFSMITGITISITPSGGITESARAPRAKVMRLLLDLNGSPALYADITAVPRSRPLALASSIIAIDAASPTDPSRTLTVRVLGTKVGPTPPEEVEKIAPAR